MVIVTNVSEYQRRCREAELGRRRRILVCYFAAIENERNAAARVRKQLFPKDDDERERKGNYVRDRIGGMQDVNNLPPHIFRQMFRMHRTTFEKLLADVNSVAPESENYKYILMNVKGKRGTQLSNRTKLLATLRFLAGGSKWDICLAFKIGFSTFLHNSKYGVVWPMIDALNAVLKLGMDFREEKMREAAEEFANINLNSAPIFDKVVLAIDGLVIKTRQPSAKEVFDGNINCYRNRKTPWGIVVLAGCDARTRFHLFKTNNSGSTNDCIAWKNCRLKTLVEEGKLRDFLFIGDEAFANTNNFLVPWGGTGLTKDKDSFNFHLSVRRQVIERAFGIMVHRWGILWRPLTCALNRWGSIVLACAKLHNFCIDEMCPPPPRWPKDWDADDMPNVIGNDFNEGQPLPDRPAAQLGDKRRNMTQQLKDLKICRPEYANLTSRAASDA